MNTLKVDINGTIYVDKVCGISIGYNKTVLDATVFVDDSDIVNHFNVSCDSKWIDIQRIRNVLTITVDKNTELAERSGVIEFTHNLDSDVYINLIIWQEACEYAISVNRDYFMFDTLLDSNDPDSATENVIVTTLNGMCDFGLGPVVEYVRNFEYGQYKPNDIIFDGDTYYVKNGDKYVKGNTIQVFPYIVQDGDEYYYYELNDAYRDGETIWAGQKYWLKNDNEYKLLTASEDIVVSSEYGSYYRFSNDYVIAYDNGLKLTKKDSQTLEIVNYGKVCLYDDFYYILTLYHINNPRCVAQIRIDYVDSFVNNESGFDLDDD